MNTNHDALREALEPCPFCGENSDLRVYEHYDDAYVQCRECTTCGPDGGDRAGAIAKWNHRAFPQPMSEAASQGATVADLQRQMRELAEAAYKTPGVAVKMPELVAVEGRKFMRGEPSLLDQLPFGEMQSVTDMLSVSPAAPEGADPEREIEQLIRERDQRDEIIDRLCDAVLGSERPEWSSAYGFDDAVADVEERITQLHQPSVDKAWKRFETANAAQPQHPQPQAHGGPEVVAWAMPRKDGLVLDVICPDEHEAHEGDYTIPLITLQSHREAVSKLQNDLLGWKVSYERVSEAAQDLSNDVKELREALAQHRAALEECVGALKLAMHWAGPAMERDMRSPSNSQWMVEKTQAQEDSIYAAITHANQVLEGGRV